MSVLYDIRNKNKAAKTLECLTGVSALQWLKEREINAGRFDYTDVDRDIINLVNRYGGHILGLSDLELVVTHITTSNNGCNSILNSGLVDLKKAYGHKEGELRTFLEINGISIDIDACQLTYGKESYDISYGKCPRDHESIDYAAWSIGRKFYYDFTVCGFLSMNKKDIYGGYVHKRPEILSDIDRLLGTELAVKWMQTHDAYQVVFSLPVSKFVYSGEDTDTEYEMVMNYLSDAYMCICTEPDTKEILCQNGIEVLPENIMVCRRFNIWN